MPDDPLKSSDRDGDRVYATQAARAGAALTWILLGFGLAYLLFFVWPIFLSGTTMQSPPVVPSMTPIGADLRETLVFSKFWLSTGTPFVLTATYPPLSYLLFIPLLSVAYADRYLVFSILSLIAYGLSAFAFPLSAMRRRRSWPILILIVTTGLISYGFQFELERGQFDWIAMALTCGAVWIYHARPRARLLAFILLTLAVQLKIYPLVFALLLVDDWHDWKHNLAALGSFAAANFALLFVLGPGIFVSFVNAILQAGQRPDLIWIGNHSAHSFANLVARHALIRGVAWTADATNALQIGLVVAVCLCVAALIVRAYRRHQTGLNPALLLACTLAAMLIPSVSNDYKLSILGGALAVFLVHQQPEAEKGFRRIMLNLALFAISLAYAATLFPPGYKPQSLIFQDNFPALFGMLLLVTSIGWWSDAQPSIRAGEVTSSTEVAAQA